jgi:hypothetical protein
MAIIYTYPQKSQPVGADSLLITDSEDNNATKTVTIADIRGATTSGVESLIAGDNIVLDPAGGTGDVTVSTTGEAEKIVEVVYNDTGSTILKGQPLHITGVNGTIPTVAVADASNPLLMPVSGLANEDIPTMSSGEMIVSGILEGINTSGIDGSPAEAAIIYVSNSTTVGSGSIDYLSANAPAGESNQIQNIGIIVKDSPGTSGSLQVTAIGRSNATPNLNRGSIFIGDASNQSSTLAIGANTHVLTSDGTTASWAAIPTQAAEDLATTLVAGNTTGGNDISITSGDSIVFSNVPWTGELSVASLTANRTYALPNQSGLIPAPGYPGAAQDGYVVTWVNASNEYQLLAAGASGGGIYGGSGSLSGNTTVTQGTNTLAFNNEGDSYLEINASAGTPTTDHYAAKIVNSKILAGSISTGLDVVVDGVGNNGNVGVDVVVNGSTTLSNRGVQIRTNDVTAGDNTALYLQSTNGGAGSYAIITLDGQSGFGTTTPDPAAIVDIESSDKGFKVPTLTSTSNVSPTPTTASAGLIIFETTTSQFKGWNGSSWVILG